LAVIEPYKRNEEDSSLHNFTKLLSKIAGKCENYQ